MPRKKLTEYLVSTSSPKGKLFRKWGFDESNIEILEAALLKIAHTRKVVSSEPSSDKSGINYAVDGKISLPIGGTIIIKTIWYIINGEVPIFVTAYPLR